MASEPWQENQFYSETNTHQITVTFNPGKVARAANTSFSLVITPLVLSCLAASGFDGNLFQCGGEEGGYCVDSGLVCDGRVNCVMPSGPHPTTAQDENNVYCRKLRGRVVEGVEEGRGWPGVVFGLG